VGDTLGDLRSWDAAASLKNLSADLLVDLHGRLLLHQVIPVGVSSADNLDLIDVVRVEGGGSHANPVHLTDEDLVSEEVATPDSAVRVGEVVAGLLGDIDELTKDGLGSVVLLLSVIEVLSVLLDIIISNHVSQKLEGVVVLMVDGRGIIEDTDVGVVHLVITHHEESWNVDALV